MSHKLTKRHISAIDKMMANKGQLEQRKEARSQRRLAKAQQQERTPRQRAWDDADAAPSYEKIRRLKVEAPAAAAQPDAAPAEIEAGTVIEVRSGDSLVSLRGRVLRALLPLSMRSVSGMRSPIAVGDRVQLEPVAAGEARIARVLPRRSALRRTVYDPSRDAASFKGQVIAANIDQVVIVCSPLTPPFRPRLIDRYLVAASLDALPVLVCLNKCDLGVPPEVERYLAGYARLGVESVRTSAVDRSGLDVLRERLAGKASLLTGHSGVGKSSLLNAVEPGLALRVNDVTTSTAGQGKGRHTTSSARLVPLSLPDTFVVDSPGIRAFGVKGVAPQELASHFVDIAALAADCAYRDCLHRGEPDCAVDVEAHHDWFLRERLASYRSMLQEVS
jgi:ribosome biogenesis GTPase